MTGRFGDGVLIADVSARTRTNHPAVSNAWVTAVRADQIATCSIVTLELLYTARDQAEVEALRADEASLRSIPVTVSVQRAAMAAISELSARGAGHHRVKLPDVLIAAAAQEAGVGVLHYDHHYDRLAEVLSFESRWLAAPGSL